MFSLDAILLYVYPLSGLWMMEFPCLGLRERGAGPQLQFFLYILGGASKCGLMRSKRLLGAYNRIRQIKSIHIFCRCCWPRVLARRSTHCSIFCVICVCVITCYMRRCAFHVGGRARKRAVVRQISQCLYTSCVLLLPYRIYTRIYIFELPSSRYLSC